LDEVEKGTVDSGAEDGPETVSAGTESGSGAVPGEPMASEMGSNTTGYRGSYRGTTLITGGTMRALWNSA
jgi:hypothetical protein